MYAAKAVAAFVLTLVTLFIAVLTDNQVDQGEWSQAAATVVDALFVLLTALGVYAVPNRGSVTRRVPQ